MFYVNVKLSFQIISNKSLYFVLTVAERRKLYFEVYNSLS